jgi:hypothetical protein
MDVVDVIYAFTLVAMFMIYSSLSWHAAFVLLVIAWLAHAIVVNACFTVSNLLGV